MSQISINDSWLSSDGDGKGKVKRGTCFSQ